MKEAAIAGLKEHANDDYFFIAKVDEHENAIDHTVDDSLFPQALSKLSEMTDADCIFERESSLNEIDKHAKKLSVRLKDALKEFVKKNKFDATIHVATEEHSVALDAEGNLDIDPVTEKSNQSAFRPRLSAAVPLDDYISGLREQLESPVEKNEYSEEERECCAEEASTDLVSTADLEDIWG